MRSHSLPSVSIFILNTSFLTRRLDIGLVVLAKTCSQVDTVSSIVISVVFGWNILTVSADFYHNEPFESHRVVEFDVHVN
jgi:hypothetical protein